MAAAQSDLPKAKSPPRSLLPPQFPSQSATTTVGTGKLGQQMREDPHTGAVITLVMAPLLDPVDNPPGPGPAHQNSFLLFYPECIGLS